MRSVLGVLLFALCVQGCVSPRIKVTKAEERTLAKTTYGGPQVVGQRQLKGTTLFLSLKRSYTKHWKITRRYKAIEGYHYDSTIKRMGPANLFFFPATLLIDLLAFCVTAPGAYADGANQVARKTRTTVHTKPKFSSQKMPSRIEVEARFTRDPKERPRVSTTSWGKVQIDVAGQAERALRRGRFTVWLEAYGKKTYTSIWPSGWVYLLKQEMRGDDVDRLVKWREHLAAARMSKLKNVVPKIEAEITKLETQMTREAEEADRQLKLALLQGLLQETKWAGAKTRRSRADLLERLAALRLKGSPQERDEGRADLAEAARVASNAGDADRLDKLVDQLLKGGK